MPKSNLDLSRRRLVLGALQGTGLVLLSGCEKLFNGLLDFAGTLARTKFHSERIECDRNPYAEN